ncbi:hypothetical protein [Dactylosporangium sp. NPDC051541]|uniref:hypothetical protein n=1 Tax=Dactylosporangium sp. NPDC051541 TaxID=3363977 RepID=UPI00378E9682
MLGRHFGRGLDGPVFDTDVAFDDLELRHARDLVREHREWRAGRDILAAARGQHEIRGRRFAVLADEAAEDDGWLVAWMTAEPGNADAAVLFAAQLLTRAGNARGGATAAKTSAARFAAFHDLKAAAQEASRRAIALAPDDPVPWTDLVGSMVGSSAGDAFGVAMGEGLRRDRYNFDLHLTAVTYLCQKWHGSHARMFAAARMAHDGAPAGASAHVVPVFAHFEYAMREFSWDLRTPATLRAVQGYFRRPDVLAEVDACAHRFAAGPRRRYGRVPACRSWLTLAYVLAGRKAAARAWFAELMPHRAGVLPWEYFYPSANEGFRSAWHWANG